MNERIDMANRKLEEKKERILAQQKLLAEKKKRQKIKEFIEIGKLAEKCGISHLEREVLLGAFSEISEKMHDLNFIESCKSRSNELNGLQKNLETQFAITFKEIPGKEIAKSLRDMGFQWNRFRKEFYGTGRLDEIQKAIGNAEYTFEEIF